jgi:hypothetical protein
MAKAGMNIIVCIKQVIAGDQVKIDPATHSLVRSPEFSRINPSDLFALNMAAQIKKEYSGSVTAVTMGPEISEEVLWEALAIGADRAILLSDRRFASSDTLATSYVLGMGVVIGRFDRSSAECELLMATPQVGQLAEEPDIPMSPASKSWRRRKSVSRGTIL